jgi:predicted ATPase
MALVYLKRIVCKNLRGFDTLDLDLCPLASPTPAKGSRADRAGSSLRDFDETMRRLSAEGTAYEAPLPETEVPHDPDSYYPGWSVITGDNGAGKTTVLKAIALAVLGPSKARYLQENVDGWVSYGETSAEISLEVRPDNTIDKARGGGAPYKNTFWAEVDIVRGAAEGRTGPAWELKQADHFRQRRKGAGNGPWQATPGWLAMGYGPFRRLYGSSPSAAGIEADPLKARFATLFKEDATLIGAEKWLQELDYQRVRDSREDAAAILHEVTDLLQADFLRNEMTFDRVDSEGVWLRDANGRNLQLADMSEGYRAALAMLIDIVRHMYLAYGADSGVIKYSAQGDPFVARPAVVLIDEVDAHLHPAWQREIGPWLTRHFPRVQFIVTTHSPLVCQAADGGRVYVLPAPASGEDVRQVDVDEYVRIVTGKPDDILQSSAFGLIKTYSSRMSRVRDRHARLRQLSLFEKSPEFDAEYEQLEMLVEGRVPEES